MSQDFVYPASDLDRAETILSFLGSLWSTTYQGQHQVLSLIEGKAELEKQSHLRLLELVAAVSRFNVPIFHTDNWYLLTLKESDRNADTASMPKYNGTHRHEIGGIAYGRPVSRPGFTWAVPADLQNAAAVMNRITATSRTLLKDVDFTLTPGESIQFRQDPFKDQLFATREVIASDGVVDREIALWLFKGEFDWQTIYKQFGYVLQLQLSSSEAYRDLVNAIMDALVEGTTIRHTQLALSAITGVPLTRDSSETVEQVITEPDRQLVVTDKHVYAFPLESQITVAVGDVLQQGDPLSDGLVFYEFNRGVVPAADEIRALTTGDGFLTTGYFGELVWENKDVPLQSTVDDDGRVKVSWELGGWPGDVEKFFDDLHTRGLADGRTLANLLDRRAEPTDEPPAGALPSTINPVAFLVSNVFRHHVVVAKIRMVGSQQGAGLEAARLLRKIVPPHTVLLLVITLAAPGDTLRMNEAGSETAPGCQEAVSTFQATSASDTLSGSSMLTESVRVRVISGRCR